MFANTEILHLDSIDKETATVLNFEVSTPEAIEDIDFGGIKVFLFCDNKVEMIASLYETAKMMGIG